MNGRAIPGAYLFRLYVCDKEMSWPHRIGETHQPDWLVYVRDSEKFRLTNVIPERIIFVNQGITVCWIWWAFQRERGPLGGSGLGRRISLRWMLNRFGGRGLVWSGWGKLQVGRFYECGYEHPGSVNLGGISWSGEEPLAFQGLCST